jgi:pimeloyl-ACP methyl ester carboxylesterase
MFFEINGVAGYAATGNRTPDPCRKSVLFVHGAGQDHSIWDLPTRHFAHQDCNVIAVDLPAHGRSAGAPLATVEAIADWLVEVLDAMGLGKTVLVGNSLGSLAALAVADRNLARVQAIALLGVTLPMPVNEVLLEAAKNNRHEAIEMLAQWSFSKSTLAGADPALRDLLLILGEGDRLTLARSADRLAALLPHAETIMLEGCGHAMLAEQPDLVLNQLIRVV